MLNEKDKTIESLRTDNDKLKTRRTPMASTQKSMTGLPKSVVSQNTSLKFKTKKNTTEISDTSSQSS